MILSNYLFFSQFFLVGQSTMREFFGLTPWVLLFFIPALTMRTWSEEKRTGTIENLFTFPISNKDVIFGKFFSIFIVILIALAISLLIPISLDLIPRIIGERIAVFDWGRIFSGYTALLLFSTSLLILGQTISYTTKNQIIAFLLSISLGFILYIIGQPFFLYSMPEFLRSFIQELSLGFHYNSISKGVITVKDLVFFGSFFILFYKIHDFLLQDR